MEAHETPFETSIQDILSEVPEDEFEGSLGARETASLVVRTVTVLLTLTGAVAILLVNMIKRRGRGSWLEALVVITIQLVWQVTFRNI